MDSIDRFAAELKNAIAAVAAKHALAPDWFNDYTALFRLREAPNEDLLYEGACFTVRTAAPSYILAMKLFAARHDTDRWDVDDAAVLMEECGMSTVDELVGFVEDMHKRGISAIGYIPERTPGFCEDVAARRNELFGRRNG